MEINQKRLEIIRDALSLAGEIIHGENADDSISRYRAQCARYGISLKSIAELRDDISARIQTVKEAQEI